MNSIPADFVGPVQNKEQTYAPRRDIDAHDVRMNESVLTAKVEAKAEAKTEAEAEAQQRQSLFSSAMDTIQQTSSVAGILRMCGAGLLVFSLSLFLIQGVEATTDLQRYFLLIGQTVMLTIAGFAVGYLLKEPRGARVFFGLGLVSIPANFAVLGAMIYSILPMDTLVTSYPSYASWHSSSVSELIIASVAGAVVLVPMSLFCFAIFARQSKFWLSTGYLLASASLLIPLRDTFSVTLLSSVTVISIVVLLTHKRSAKGGPSTAEERFARALLFAPAVLMLARSAMLYSVDFHFALALVISTYYLLRQSMSRFQGNSRWLSLFRLGTVTTAMLLSGMLTSLVTTHIPAINETVFFSVLLAALFAELSRGISSPRMLSFMQIAWSLLTVASLMLDYLMWNGPASVITSVFMAAVVMAGGVMLRNAIGTAIGFMALLGQLVLNGHELIASLLSSGWIGMAITGASIIVLGSLIERFWPSIRLRFVIHKKASGVDSDTPGIVKSASGTEYKQADGSILSSQVEAA